MALTLAIIFVISETLMTNISQITPSQRDLVQFISPNQNDQNQLIGIDSIEKFLNLTSEQFKKWEDDEISGIILFSTIEDINKYQEEIFKKIKTHQEDFTATFLIHTQLSSKDDISLLRSLLFDAIILSPNEFSLSKFEELKIIAQTMHVRLIPVISEKSSLEQFSSEKFIYLTQAIELPENSSQWFLAKNDFPNCQKLKGIVI